MKVLVRLVVVVLVLAVLVGVAAFVAEGFVRAQVEQAVTDGVERELAQRTDDGGEFASVESRLQGSALLGLVRGEFDEVRVDASDGVVEGVPIDELTVQASGVSPDGGSVDALTATLRADAAGVLASQLDPELADTVVESTVAVPPDRVRVVAPLELPILGEVPVDVEVEVRAAAGGVVIEPVAAVAGGFDLDITQLDALPSYGFAADELPGGLRVDTVEVVDDDGRAVLVADLSCPTGCALTG